MTHPARWNHLALLVLMVLSCDGTLDPVRGQPLRPLAPTLAEPTEPDALDHVEVSVTVRTDGELVAISPRIYGVYGHPDYDRGYSLSYNSNQRWSAYNWENNASNAGSGYLYQNDSYFGTSDDPGAPVRRILEAARKAGATAAIEVPIMDYVAADKGPGGDVRDSGEDYLATRFRRNLPVNPAGSTATPDPADGFVYQSDYATWVRSDFEGTDVCFVLDTTPDLWTRFHPEIHPDPVGYEELVRRTLDFATALKDVWPEAPVVGLGSYGWTGWETLEDSVSSKQPADAAGKGAFLDYWLDELAAAHAASGRRVVDLVDLHWYSEARAGGTAITSSDTSEPVVEARLQAPRSLWDPTYVEDSWIVDVATHGQPLQWLVKTQDRIREHYAGTGLAVGSWSYGASHHISGALATADALGAFGRYGVALAAHGATSEPFVGAAFAAYRNFDGEGSRFGDTALSAVSSDVERVTVYGSLDWAAQSRVVVLLINKPASPTIVGLRLAHPVTYGSARTWVLTGDTPALVPGEQLQAVGRNAFRWSLPARSVTVLLPSPATLRAPD